MKKKKYVITAHWAQNIWTITIFLTVKLSQHSNSGSTFSSSKPVTTGSDCCLLKCPNQPKLCLSTAPSAWPLILQLKAEIVFWNSCQKWLPDDLQGIKPGLKLGLCLLTNEMWSLLWNPWIKCVEFWLLQPSPPRILLPVRLCTALLEALWVVCWFRLRTTMPQ